MDGWFQRLSPSGLHVVRGSVELSTEDRVIASATDGGGTAAVWADEHTVLFKRHADGRFHRWTPELGVEPMVVEGTTPVVNSLTAAGGRWAYWAEDAEGPFVRTSLGRVYRGFGGGMNPLSMAPDGTLVMGHQTTGQLYVVRWGSDVLTPLGRGILPRCGQHGVVWEDEGRIWYASLIHPVLLDITIPGERCMKPVLIDGPTGEWVLCHTHTRLLLFPLGRTHGLIVVDGDVTEWPDGRTVANGFRVVWTQHGGEPGEAPVIPFTAPMVDLSASAVWHPAGTMLDTMPFQVPTYLGVLRCPEDGQTLQSLRVTGERELVCMKGSPSRQERWTWDESRVYLTYDATNRPADQPLQPWCIQPFPVWARRVGRVGDQYDNGPSSVMWTRRLDGSTAVQPFPVTTGLRAYGEHVPIRGIGRCRVLVVSWAPNWPASAYEERHWYAIRESDEMRFGRVRYEEWRHGVLDRAFDFVPSDVEPLVPDPPLSILPPVEDPDPIPEEPDVITFPPRDETLRFTEALDEFYRDTLHRDQQPLLLHTDMEGIAVWMQEYLRHRVSGVSHEDAQARTFQEIRYETGIDPRPR